MKRAFSILLLLLCLHSAVFAVNGYRLSDLVETPSQWEYRSGKVARGIDGDTIEMADGTHIRMAGINSPEVKHGGTPAQPGGDEARAWTAERLAGKTIRYYVDSKNATDKYGRTVALIFYWSGGSYNIDMIQTGHAEAAYLFLAKDLKDEVFEKATSGSAKPQISINSGTYPELDGLPNVGSVMAQRIIDGRPYASLADLQRVKGIGPKRLGLILPFVKL